MNLAQAITELKARGFDYLSDARATNMLNNARNAFEDYVNYPWQWLDTTVTSNAPVTINDLKYIIYVTDATNRRELIGRKPADIISEENPDITTAGPPMYWWLDGLTSLKVYPVQVVSLNVRYVKFSPELSGTDTPLIPARYHHIWLDLAVVEAYKDQDNFQAAQALEADVDRRLGDVIGVYESRNRQNPDYQITTLWSAEDWT